MSEALTFQSTVGEQTGTSIIDDWPDEDEVADEWNCQSEQKKAIVEVKPQVPATLGDTAEYDWIALPVANITHWMRAKNEVSVRHVVEVSVQNERGNEGITNVNQLLKQFQRESGSNRVFLKARVRWRDYDETGIFDVRHVGWVSNLSGGSNPLESNFWIYDFSRMFDGIAVSESLTPQSTVSQVAEEFIGESLQKSPIPVSDIVFTKTQPASLLEDVIEDEFNDVDIGNVTINQLNNTDEGYLDGLAGSLDESIGRINPFNKSTGPWTFRPNRDTIKDVLDKLCEEIAASYRLVPVDNGEALVLAIDFSYEPRTFVQTPAVSAWDGPVHEEVTVNENDALAAINPITTIEVRGSMTNVFDDGARSAVTKRGGETLKEFPVATATATPLLAAAGGTEVKETIHADSPSTFRCAVKARTELLKRLKQEGEGDIRLRGEKDVLPGDRIVSFETCGDFFEGTQEPVEYEVKTVRHEQSGGEIFTTACTTSVHIAEEDIEVRTTKQPAKEN